MPTARELGYATKASTKQHAAHLTTRQLQVLRLVTTGLPNREIGRQLGVSEACVKFHLTSLFRHYGVDNRVSVVVRAIAEGLVTTHDPFDSRRSANGDPPTRLLSQTMIATGQRLVGPLPIEPGEAERSATAIDYRRAEQ